MTDLDTRIDGSPGSIRAVGHWLRDSFGNQADEMATAVFRGRSTGLGAWDGPASTAFGNRAKVLAEAAQHAHESSLVADRDVERLATALDRALDDMGQVRRTAGADDLTVSGTVIHDPGQRMVVQGTPPGPDATPRESARYEQVKEQVKTQNDKVDAFEKACKAADSVFKDWAAAVEDSASALVRWDKELVSMTADFLTGGASAALVLRTAPILMKQSEFLADTASRLREHAGALKTPTGRVYDPKTYYDLLDRASAAETDAARVARSARNVEIPKGIGRGLGILGVVATGYSIHEDMEEGESATQAVTSNVGGMVAGMAAGAAAGAPIGALVGTFIPVPGVGTAVGFVAGAAVGSVVGAFTSGAIDSMFENGITDLGAAASAGIDAVTDLGSAVGDLAGDAWDAIF
ncbi:hypothetical protein GCM10027517_15780 [Phycicoccus ginsengisoli]